MRVNVYTEELFALNPDGKVNTDRLQGHPRFAEIVTADYVSSRTGEKMTNYGVRIYQKSAPELHYVPPRDDDRSAVTFWCGPSEKNVFAFLETVRDLAYQSTLDTWHAKTEKQQTAAEASIAPKG